jgi:RHS repeat-associated protein
LSLGREWRAGRTRQGAIYNGVDDALSVFGMGGNQGDAAPGAYLNYILFDKNHNVLDMGWQVATGFNSLQEIAIPNITIQQEGFIFVYLSYESESNNYVQFDDFKVTHTKTNVIQYNEYYPFGLQTSTSWTRENNSNRYLYNEGSELNAESGFYDLPFRNCDAAIGRFIQVDPMALLDHSVSAYAYAGNNPAYFNDPLGLFKQDQVGAVNDFIDKALSGNGGHWASSAEKPTYFNSDKEQAAHVAENWDLFGSVEDSNGGSGMAEFAHAKIKGMAAGRSWVIDKHQYVIKGNRYGNTSVRYTGKGDRSAQQGPTEITAQMINDIIAGLPKDGTSGQFLGIAVDLLKKYDNAFVKGSTIAGLIKNPSADVGKILSQIKSINKNGTNLNLSITSPIVYDLPVGKVTINTKNSFSIDKLTSSLIAINVTGIQTSLGPLNRIEINNESVQIRLKVGFVNVWKTVAEFK